MTPTGARASSSRRSSWPARSGDHGALAAAYTARAMLAALHGDLPANAHFYDVALDHAERAGDVAQIVRIRTNRGSRLNEQGQYAQAVTELDLAITTAELAGSDTFSSLAYNNRGEAYLALGQLDLALADLRRAHDIWTRLASNRDPLSARSTWASCSSCAVSAARRSPCSTRRSASPPASVTPKGSSRPTSDWPTPSIGTTRTPPPRRPAGRSRRTTRCGCRTPTSPPATSPCHSGDLDAAADWAAKATELAGQRHDRPALAEALLLRANLGTVESATSPSRRAGCGTTSATRSARPAPIWCSPARPPAGSAKSSSPSAERMLQDAGAWGVLADARRELGEGVDVVGRHRHARRLPGEPGRRARRRRRVGVAQGARPRQAARRPARRPGRARRGHRTALAGRTRPLGTAPVGAVEHRAQRVRSAQAAESRPLRRRRPRHRVARA